MKRFIDIGANLTDRVYEGFYHGSKKHEEDLVHVLNRAWSFGLEKIIITGGTLRESKTALEMARTNEKLYSTVGCHPTRCLEFDKYSSPDDYFKQLERVLLEGGKKIVAYGECGLDYDRLHFCPKDIQKKYFKKQLEFNKKFQLPLFLHSRNSAEDFIEILSEFKDNLKGVVHSFTGNEKECESYLNLGLYIGINGCSLKTQENLEVVKQIPNDKILIETDCPYCDIKPTHASYSFVKTHFDSSKKEKWSKDKMVKGRNEPCTIVQVLEVIAKLKNEDETELSKQILNNTNKLFFSN